MSGRAWLFAYARLAETREEAQEALAAPPSFSPVPPDLADSEHAYLDGAFGEVLRPAGRVDEALPLLERQARRCARVELPMQTLSRRASIEATRSASRGDHDGACNAYKAVLTQWEHAKPKSVTERRQPRRGGLRSGAPD